MIEGPDGKIGELDYIRDDSQFWHEYQVMGLSEEAEHHRRHDFNAFWASCSLRNRKYRDYITKGFIPAPRDGVVVPIRGLFVPDEFYTGAK